MKREDVQTIDGQNIVYLNTLRSMYDDGIWLDAVDDEGNRYRIKTHELIKLLNCATFRKKKARKYTHLVVDSIKQESA